MLSDSKFRRTARCGHYAKLLAEKEKGMRIYPVTELSGTDVTSERLSRDGLDQPLLISADASKGLGLQLPPPGSTLRDIAKTIGPFTPVKIIEVGTQTQLDGHFLGEYAEYLAGYTPGSHKVLNMITLECSGTPLASSIQSPTTVRDVDWIDTAWPLERRARGDYPAVQRYCLSGMSGSYTDFHVDFGGTSVWYHVLSGHKRFYLVPPTCENLAAYSHWTTSSTNEDVFFGDFVQASHDANVLKARADGDLAAQSTPQVFLLDLLPGQTLFIPGAWIHAVFTPEDSLVFGGNFLHSVAILRQLQVHQVESKTRVGKQYRFPFFKELHWYVLCRMLPVLRRTVTRLQKRELEQGMDTPAILAVEWEEFLDDEDDEDLAALGQAVLTSAAVLRQFPYLVRACWDWLDVQTSVSGCADATKLAVITATSLSEYDTDTGATLTSSADIVGAWWDLLQDVAKLQSAAAIGTGIEETAQHIRRIQLSCKDRLDFLDPAFVSGGLLGANLLSWPEPALQSAESKDESQFSQPLPKNKLISAAPTDAKADVVTEKRGWVCCEKCGKWRSLPPSVDATTLPDEWVCAMNSHDDRNTCEAEEEAYNEGDDADTVVDAALPVAVLEERQWVQCTLCDKWRTVAAHIVADDLPEDWCCEDSTWDTERAACEAPEETDGTAAAAVQEVSLPSLKLKKEKKSVTPKKLVLTLSRKSKLSPIVGADQEQEPNNSQNRDGNVKKRKLIHLTFTPKGKKGMPMSPTGDMYAAQYESLVRTTPTDDTTSGRTRGKKLSAKFLRETVDADVADSEEDDIKDYPDGYEVMPSKNVPPALMARFVTAAQKHGIAVDTLVSGTVLTDDGKIMAAPSKAKSRGKVSARFVDNSDNDEEWGEEKNASSSPTGAENTETVSAADFDMSDSDQDELEISEDEDEDNDEYVSDDGLDMVDDDDSEVRNRNPRKKHSSSRSSRNLGDDEEEEHDAEIARSREASSVWKVKKFSDTVVGGSSSSSSSGAVGGVMPSLASLVGSSAAAAAASAAPRPGQSVNGGNAPVQKPKAGGVVQGRAMLSKSLMAAQSKPPPVRKPPSREALLKKLGMR